MKTAAAATGAKNPTARAVTRKLSNIRKYQLNDLDQMDEDGVEA